MKDIVEFIKDSINDKRSFFKSESDFYFFKCWCRTKINYIVDKLFGWGVDVNRCTMVNIAQSIINNYFETEYGNEDNNYAN